MYIFSFRIFKFVLEVKCSCMFSRFPKNMSFDELSMIMHQLWFQQYVINILEEILLASFFGILLHLSVNVFIIDFIFQWTNFLGKGISPHFSGTLFNCILSILKHLRSKRFFQILWKRNTLVKGSTKKQQRSWKVGNLFQTYVVACNGVFGKLCFALNIIKDKR